MNKNIIRLIIAAVAIVLVTAGIAYATRDTPKHRIEVNEPGNFLAEPETTTTTTDAPLTTTVAPTTTMVETTPPTTAAPLPPPPTAPPCHNSSDPSCGPLSWTITPAAKLPMTISVAPSASGLTGTFHVAVHSSQMVIDHDCVTVDYGDGVTEPASCAFMDCAAQYGPWDPPSTQPDDLVKNYVHTYDASGTYAAKFTFVTGPACAGHPYANTVTGSAAVVVG